MNIAPITIVKYGWLLFCFLTIFITERLVPYYIERGLAIRHDVRNIAMGILNIGIIGLAFGFVTEWAAGNDFGLLARYPLPPALRIFVTIIVIDLYMYWWHRFNHTLRFLWRFHRVHHSDLIVDVSSAYRFHIVEIAMSFIGRFGLILLFDLGVIHIVIYEMIFSLVVYFHHSNIAIPEKADRFLRILFITPHLHRVHHSVKRVETDSNYGSVFSIWDRLFRSFRLVRSPLALVQGLETLRDDAAQTLRGMLITPFLKE